MDEADRQDHPAPHRGLGAKRPVESGATAEGRPERTLPNRELHETRELPTPLTDPENDSVSEHRGPPWTRAGQPPLPAAPGEEDLIRGRRRQGTGIWIVGVIALAALFVALFSLALNYFLIQELGAARQETRNLLDEAIVGLEGASLGDVAFSYVFSETIVYSGTIPISETIVFPFQGTVPFQGRVPFQGMVPISIDIPLLGRQVIRVPINTSVDVDTAVDVSTTVTIPVTMNFPFSIELPLELPVDVTLSLDEQPALTGVLQQLRDVLIELRDRVLQ
jgi:hypothetical protein